MNLYLKVDQKAGNVEAGGVLSGKLLIKATNSISASDLEIYFIGEEHRSICQGYGKHHQTTFEKSQIERLDMQIPSELQIIKDGKVEAGSYEIPFSFDLPAWIPSSRFIERSQNEAKIKYYLQAALVGSDKQCQIRRSISVKTPEASGEQYTSHIKRQAITKFGTRNCGEIACGIRVLDTQLIPGKKPQVQVSYVNNSTAAVEAIAMELIQRSHWSASATPSSAHQKEETTRRFCETTVKLDTKKTPKLDRRTVNLLMKDSNRVQWSEEQIQHERKCSKDALQMPRIPNRIMDSFESKNIHVRHELVITIQTTAYHTNLVFRVPVTIAREPQDPTEHSESSTAAPRQFEEALDEDMMTKIHLGGLPLACLIHDEVARPSDY